MNKKSTIVAVTGILKAEAGQIVSTSPGAYGGTKRTVDADVEMLNALCQHCWDQRNAAEERRRKRVKSCHYCGMPAVRTNFFDVGVCDECD